mmetsp:Transcript_1766/g.2389  ORF Transcript_1766/g.2389 Transcript_1766/m.2389 type:complete len:142 (-) Transcript_1766:187-612(-)
MVVRLRLQRFGRKNRPFYRVVAADSRSPRDGKFLEIVGTYDPITSKDGVKEVRFDSQKVRYWLSVGAQPSRRVGWLLGNFGLLPVQPHRVFGPSAVPKKEQRQEFSTLVNVAHQIKANSTPYILAVLNTGGLKSLWKRLVK